jgi:rfaE bifunctional protein nucleotidyltransferase chain/domain
VSSPASKLRSLDELAEECARWREQKLRVVLANGAFDMLHVGHLRYLADARGRGDRLVVAVNSDSSVSHCKGPERPILPEAERIEILSHLTVIDRLCLFDDPTVATVLGSLRPDLHAKGTDYTVETVPERDAVLAYGGETAICGDPKDHATTDLIGIILERFGQHDTSGTKS